MTKALRAAVIATLLASAVEVAAQERFVSKLTLPDGGTAVVAEGDFEARSTGSFSVRLYDAAPAPDETTFFTSGLVRARDGVVEKVVPADVDGDGRPEVIVVVRSAGTGNYLSAHAFATGKGKLALRATVDGLPANADPIAALRKARTAKK